MVESGDDTKIRMAWEKAVEALIEARRTFYYRDPILMLLNLVPRAASSEDVQKIVKDLLEQTPDGEPINLMLGENESLSISAEVGGNGNTCPGNSLLSKLAERHPLSLIDGFSELPHPSIRPSSALMRRFRDKKQSLPSPAKLLHRSYGTYQHSLSSLLPMYLNRFGYESVLHVPFEDAELPKAHTATGNWEGHDGTQIPAVFSKPIPVDRISSILPLMESLAETMNYHYHSSAVLGCWGTTTHWWWQDLVHVARVQPLFGSLLSLPAWLEYQADGDADRHYHPGPTSYQSQTLQKMVARSQSDPVSSIAGQHAEVAKSTSEKIIESISLAVDGRLKLGEADVLRLSENLVKSKPNESRPGHFVFNPQTTPERLTHLMGEESGEEMWLAKPVSIPAFGYTWVADQELKPGSDLTIRSSELPELSFWQKLKSTVTTQHESLQVMPLDHQFTNGFVTVTMNPKTGGIREIRNVQSKQRGFLVNHLSQQLAYSYPFEKSVHADFLAVGLGGGQSTTRYSISVCDELTIEKVGKHAVQAVSTGWLLDPASKEKICTFTQKTRLEAGSRRVEIEIQLEPSIFPQRDPWSNYYASRFAWRDQFAVVTAGLHNDRFSVENGRIESTSPVEIATEFERIAILSESRPYYKIEDYTRLDAVLVTSGESSREFRFTLSLDDALLQSTAQKQLSSLHVVRSDQLPAGNRQGWFFHLSHPQIQIADWRILSATEETLTVITTVLETSGTLARGRFTSCFPVLEAGMMNESGEIEKSLTVIEQQSFPIELHGHQLAEVRFVLKRASLAI